MMQNIRATGKKQKISNLTPIFTKLVLIWEWKNIDTVSLSLPMTKVLWE